MQLSRYLKPLCIDTLSPMQSDFIAVAKTTKQLMLLAPTGAGKTLAYLLGIVERETQGLSVIVSPSRELAQQGYDLLRRMKTDIPSACFVGGHATSHDRDVLLRQRPRIIFATPGRLLDLLQSGGIAATSIDLLVLDEYDKCLDQGFTACLTDIAYLLPAAADRWLISATQEPANVELFIDKSRAVRLDHTQQEASDRLQIRIVPSPEKDKLTTLARLLLHVGAEQTIVFASHRESVERIYAYLKAEGFSVERYHGGLEQSERERNLLRFRCGGSLTLIATDLAARGIDIPAVSAVVHYHLPADAATFAHRSGRSTRWERTGTAYLILGPEERVPDFLAAEPYEELPTEQLARYDAELKAHNSKLSTPYRPRPDWATLYIGRGKKEKLSRGDIAGFLCKKGGVNASDLGRIEVGDHQAYVAVRRSRLKSLLTAVSGEKIKGMKTLIEEAHW